MNKFEFKNLTPFKWFVLENFPFIEADFDALTEWQLFCKLGKEINKIINSTNTLGIQVESLTDYVKNYFDNLDVQEEINNKLNEMAESGELTEIISQYLQLTGLLCFNTVNDMKNATNLIDGSFVKTYGEKLYNDGLGNFYKIRELVNTDVIDNDKIIALINYPSLIAEKIISNTEKEVVTLKTEIKNKINKYIPSFIANNKDYYLRVGTKEHDKHYLQFSTDLTTWHTICDLPYEIFMQPTSYPNTYDMAILIHNNEFYIIYDYVDENYNDWKKLDNTKFLFSNRIGISKTRDFITWEKYAVETPLEYKQIADPKIFIENNQIYLTLVANDGSLTSDKTEYYHFPLICKLNESLTKTSQYVRLLNTSENIIDPYIYKEDDNYYLFAAAETPTRSIKVYKNNSITTQFTNLVDTIDYFWDDLNARVIEGPSLIKKDNLYYLFMDTNVDHINVVNITDNIESWNNCTFLSTDNIMGNAQICEINTNESKNLMIKFYEENDYPIFNKFPKLKSYKYSNFFNQTKKTLKFYILPNRVYVFYAGQWNITLDRSLMKNDIEYSTLCNVTGQNDNVKIINIKGDNTYWNLPFLETVSVTRNYIIANGKNYYVRHGHESVSNVVANTVKKITLNLPGVTYRKIKSIQLTPFTSGTNTKHIFTYVDRIVDNVVTISILSNENITSMELYWCIHIE